MESDLTEEDHLDASYNLLEEQAAKIRAKRSQGQPGAVPASWKFMTAVSPDVINPMSEEMERAMGLELFDRAIALPSSTRKRWQRLPLRRLPKLQDGRQQVYQTTSANAAGTGRPRWPAAQPHLAPSPGQPQPQGSCLAAAGQVSPLAAMGKSPLAAKF